MKKLPARHSSIEGLQDSYQIARQEVVRLTKENKELQKTIRELNQEIVLLDEANTLIGTKRQ